MTIVLLLVIHHIQDMNFKAYDSNFSDRETSCSGFGFKPVASFFTERSVSFWHLTGIRYIKHKATLTM